MSTAGDDSAAGRMAVPELQNPFKGQDSYEVEDASLFFGRDREAQELTATIMSHRVTVLHAASGVGKTSLLNARIIPRLEGLGWLPVRIRPRNHPSEAVRSAVLQYLMPPPEAEAHALREAMQVLAVPAGAQFGELLKAYDSLINPIARISLIRPVLNELEWRHTQDLAARTARFTPFRSASGVLPEFPTAVPYTCRVFRRTMEAERAGLHLAAVFLAQEDDTNLGTSTGTSGALDQDAARTARQLSYGGLADVSLSRLLQLLEASEAMFEYRRLLQRLYLPLPGLHLFFENLFSVFSDLIEDLAIVLLLDQFEEVFTRFQGHATFQSALSGHADRRSPVRNLAERPHWRIREQFFQDFDILYNGGRGEPAQLDPPTHVSADQPIRFVFSLREEYVSRLMAQVRRSVPERDRTVYRLTLLRESQAREAMQSPLLGRGFRVSDEAEHDVLRALAVEDQQVEPGPFQIVCTWIWDHRDRARGARDGEGHLMLGTECLYDAETNSVHGILRRFFDRLLDEAPHHLHRQAPELCGSLTDEQLRKLIRVEMLDVLEPLITSERTRNIVEVAQLLNAPFRRPDVRQKVVEHLERLRILRKEPRHDGEFYEITHEFLIDPILLSLDANPDQARLSRALQTLEHAWLAARPELPEPEFRTILEFQGLLDVRPPFDEVIFRTALVVGADAGTLRTWSEMCARPLRFVGTPSWLGFHGTSPPNRMALRFVEKMLAGEDSEEFHDRARRLAAPLMRCWLRRGEPEDREMVHRAARRLAEHAGH